MAYHPIMGILLFVAAVGLAYVVGRRWVRRPAPEGPPRLRAVAGRKKPSEGDAPAPDAPWVERP